MGLVEPLFGICRTILRLELYDVNFGGNESMTKRLTIALVALALFVLVAVMPVSASYYAVAPNVSQGATVFIGEQNLNITPAYNAANLASGSTGSTTIGWWASAAVVATTPPSHTVDVTNRLNAFTVASSDFVGYAGNWYIVNTSGFGAAPIFTAADPALDIRVWDFTQGTDVTSKSVTQGELLGFRVDSAMTSVFNGKRLPVNNVNGNTKVSTTAGTPFAPAGYPTKDGYVDIKVKTDSGNVLTSLYNASISSNGVAIALEAQNVTISSWFWGTAPGTTTNNVTLTSVGGWQTSATDASGQLAYPAGTYTVWAESLLNNMKDNYQNGGADYTGKTVSQTYTITLVSDTVKIEANKDTVVRSKPFSVTITGRPNTAYNVWVKGTSTMDGSYDNQPPQFQLNQAGTVVGDVLTGNYVYQNNGAISADVPSAADVLKNMGVSTNPFWANVTTSASGTRTVGLITTNWTKAQKYTIRVEQNFSGQIKSDEVDVNVEKGAVTIVAAGDQSYYLGEEVKFSGTNTETQTTYLFITGPNLLTTGAQLQSADPRINSVTDGSATTFVQASVLGDNTWSYKWGTSNVALDAGTYTVYAVSGPRWNSASALANVAYGTVSIIIKKPFVSATASQSTVAQGDNVFITGTAEGQPSQGVAIWILGKNFAQRYTQSVNSDASFSFEVKKATTTGLAAGQYFVVVQHPMQNNQFDVYLSGDTATTATNYGAVMNRVLGNSTTGGTKVFKLLGAGSLQGSDAAEALVQAINDPNVDDTYTKLQFLVEVPVIRVDPIADKHVGDKFTITATTNLAVNDDILVTVYSSSFKPTDKSQSGEFSGATGTVKVTKGDSGLNAISFDVDSSTFKPDEYLVTETAVLQTATGTALFNVLEASPITIAPTTVAPTAAITTIVTTVPPTAVPTTIPTTKAPGYGALIALIGLGAVAFIVVRRH
jgi:PGF-CTERM protein